MSYLNDHSVIAELENPICNEKKSEIASFEGKDNSFKQFSYRILFWNDDVGDFDDVVGCVSFHDFLNFLVFLKIIYEIN